MKQIINQRIEQLKEKHASIEAEIQHAQQFVQEKVAEINGVKGAIIELEHLLDTLAEPLVDTGNETP
jgi:predicted  nucleic acid-binding Zn-ribbon protein